MQVINFSASLQFGTRRYSPLTGAWSRNLSAFVVWGSHVTWRHRWSHGSLEDKGIMDKVVNNLACWACAWYCLLFSMLMWIGIADARLKWLVKRRGGDTKIRYTAPTFINNSWAIPVKSLKGADKKVLENYLSLLFLKGTLINVGKCLKIKQI